MKRERNSPRLPRPMGTTQLMQEYHKTHNPETLEKVQTYLIQNWLLRNGDYMGFKMNIYQLSEFLGCHVSKIHEQMKNVMLGTRLFESNDRTEIVDMIMGQSVAWALEDRMEVQQQVDLLKQAQGSTYKPFISSEVNKAIALKMTAANALSSMVKSFGGGNVINISNNNQNVVVEDQLTVASAMGLIQQALKDNPKEESPLEYLEGAYETEFEELPTVVATNQSDISADKEALGFKKVELMAAADDYKGALSEVDETHHTLRREIELRIDQDSEDPETMSY